MNDLTPAGRRHTASEIASVSLMLLPEGKRSEKVIDRWDATGGEEVAEDDAPELHTVSFLPCPPFGYGQEQGSSSSLMSYPRKGCDFAQWCIGRPRQPRHRAMHWCRISEEFAANADRFAPES